MKALYFVLALVAIVALNAALDLRDRALAQAADRYEHCVWSEYHTTPQAVREMTGDYPECD